MRLLQNENPHVNLGLQRLQRSLSRSGNATPKKRAPFFEEIDEILSDKPATRPVIVLSSTSLESAQSKETELKDGGEKSPQLSCSYPTLEKENRKKADEKLLCSKFVVVSMLTRKCDVCLLDQVVMPREKKETDKMAALLFSDVRERQRKLYCELDS